MHKKTNNLGANRSDTNRTVQSQKTGQSVGEAKTGEPREKMSGTSACLTYGLCVAQTHTRQSGENFQAEKSQCNVCWSFCNDVTSTYSST